MFCESCGAKIENESVFCGECGAKIISPHVTMPSNSDVRSKWSIGGVIKGILAAFGALALVFVLYVLLVDTDYVEMVKDSSLSKYNYGESIGESLNEWFDGNVTWDSYETYGTTYVTATGVCPYVDGLFDSNQTFTFMIVDDDHFRFIGAYGSDGYEICSKNTGSWVNDIYFGLASRFGLDIHDVALKAAFGDQESLDIFKGE
jgi:hypothetical protein